MEEFPFSEAEWESVREATHRIMNATLADDATLQRSLMIELETLLDSLHTRYGRHPVLIETRADFEEDPTRQVALYREALHQAIENRLPTLSIRLSLAQLLLNDFRDADEAEMQLAACQDELLEKGDEDAVAQWSVLMGQCGKR